MAYGNVGLYLAGVFFNIWINCTVQCIKMTLSSNEMVLTYTHDIDLSNVECRLRGLVGDSDCMLPTACCISVTLLFCRVLIVRLCVWFMLWTKELKCGQSQYVYSHTAVMVVFVEDDPSSSLKYVLDVDCIWWMRIAQYHVFHYYNCMLLLFFCCCWL